MNKIVVITGGSGGLGQELDRMFSENNDIVCSLSRRSNADNGYTCDVTDEESIYRAVNEIGKKYGKIDILILGAGVGLAGAIETTPSQMTKTVFDVNLFGAVNTVKASLKYMTKGSKVIAVSSASAFFALPYRSVYSASKSALNIVMAGLYMELKNQGIQVCSVCPGEIDTPFTSNRLWNINDDKYKSDLEEINLKFIKHKKSRMSACDVARKIYKKINKKHLPPFFIIGAKYRIFYFFSKILPSRLLLNITMKLYGGKA